MQDREEKAVPDISWRSQQVGGNQRWREVRLIIDSIKELQASKGSIESALAAAEQERGKLSVPGYMRHLREQVRQQNKAQRGDESGEGGN